MVFHRILETLLDNWLEYTVLGSSITVSSWVFDHIIFGVIAYFTAMFMMYEQGMVNVFHRRFIGEQDGDGRPAARRGANANFNYQFWVEQLVERQIDRVRNWELNNQI